jgi:hypothetical protein
MKLLINLFRLTFCKLFLDRNIILKNLYSNSIFYTLYSSLKVKNQIPRPYKITDKLQFFNI